MKRDPFDIYYSVGEIAKRLGVSDKTIRRKLQAGEFGSKVVRIGDDIRVPYFAGILPWLEGHAYRYNEAQREFNRHVISQRLKLREVNEGGLFCEGISARTAGELRRKIPKGPAI